MTTKNTKWISWENRNQIEERNQPAIYFIAYSESEDLTNRDFALIEEIVYIGMTISKKGLKGRLDQFEKAMRGADGVHGGAERVRFKYNDAKKFFSSLSISNLTLSS